MSLAQSHTCPIHDGDRILVAVAASGTCNGECVFFGGLFLLFSSVFQTQYILEVFRRCEILYQSFSHHEPTHGAHSSCVWDPRIMCLAINGLASSLEEKFA